MFCLLKVALGQIHVPKASKMEMMNWDPALAAKAQSWANQCTFNHSPDSQNGVVGENIAYRSFFGANPQTLSPKMYLGLSFGATGQRIGSIKLTG